ncbi:MAG: endonuclease domain-containing protein [Deltaproteobacteria bacterium]|nr:endonuclease domain-containing protein [Deltaproteobacteria bacterium]
MNPVRAKELRKNSTDAERALWRQLRAHRLARYKFRRQQPIGRYIVDFVCFEKQLIVELDGGQHTEQVAYDAERTAWLQAQRFQVLRFWNSEVLRDIESVVEVILRECERAASSLCLSPSGGERT